MEKLWKIKDRSDGAGPMSDADEIIASLLRSRGLETETEIADFFRSDYDSLPDPSSVSGMKEAIKRIASALERKERVAIYGDYDADGVTATALLFEAFSELGFEGIEYYIPDRQSEGYGMNDQAIEYLAGKGVKLIVTVDCGITNVRETEKAKELGIDVVITDHHSVPDRLPTAVAIVNPHLPDSGFSFEDLAGVGVAFKLASAAYLALAPEKAGQLKWMLDLVAIGTIADCVELLGENRTLVKYGLIVLSKTRRAGLREMFKVGRIDISEDSVPDAHQVAFQIAPRINAAGRMDHASVSYKLIVESDPVKARDMALEVEKKNQERQKVTGQIVKEIEMIAENSFRDRKFIFVANEHWPVGILGLISGKVTDRFKKPSVVLQKQPDGYVGSLRSVPEVNIMEALRECSELLSKFGGHAQAAGVSISKENIGKFCERMSEAVERRMDGLEMIPSIDIDLEIDPIAIDWKLLGKVRDMEPFGSGNKEPVFLAKGMEVKDARIVGNGSRHLKLSLSAPGSPNVLDAIGFGMGEDFSDIGPGDRLDVLFNLQEDGWNGNRKIQLRLADAKKAA